jgi:NAD(P)H-quinone oxidoreductase subunit 4
MVSHGLILAILFHLVGVIEAKVGTRELDVLNGLMNPIRGLPMVSALLVLGGMASAGIPGLVGFVTEFLVFQGSYATYPVQTLLGVVGTGLTAVYFVILLNRTCFGKLDNALAYFPRVTLGEKLPAYVLAGLIIFLGIQPNWLVKWAEPTATAMIAALPLQPQRLMDGDHQPVMPEITSTYAMASSLIVTGRPLQGPPPWAGGPDRSSMDFNRDGG